MPAWNWFLVSFALEQLLTARHLRVFPISNLEPGAIFTICNVWAGLLFGHYAFQVQLAHSLKQTGPGTVNVVYLQPRTDASVCRRQYCRAKGNQGGQQAR
jgi:hypothetical protein